MTKQIQPVRSDAGKEEAFRIFISYTHADERFREALDKHLSPLLLLGRADVWHDRHLKAGARLYEKIQGNIEAAHIVLMLISADYLASKACQGEMLVALKKSDEGAGVAIPVIVRDCDWKILPIGTLLAANKDGVPINTQLDQDVAWTQVARKIGEIVNEWEVQRVTADSIESDVPVSAASEDEQSLRVSESGSSRDRWVNRRSENDVSWSELKDELVNALSINCVSDADCNISLNVRTWGEKIIVDFTLPQHRTSRRVLIRDIGGYVGYPGYQLEVIPASDLVDVAYTRVRWIEIGDGTRVLRQTMPRGKDVSTGDFAYGIWAQIKKMAVA